MTHRTFIDNSVQFANILLNMQTMALHTLHALGQVRQKLKCFQIQVLRCGPENPFIERTVCKPIHKPIQDATFTTALCLIV